MLPSFLFLKNPPRKRERKRNEKVDGSWTRKSSSQPSIPLESEAYKIIDDIEVCFSAKVYKVECVRLDSTVVAIKFIDLD